MQIPFWTQHGTIDLAMIRAQDVTAEKLADTLSKLNRFNGRTRKPWSVAAHSVLVAQLVRRELRPWAILHDAHEAFIGDVTSPAIQYLCASGTKSAIEHAVGNAKGKLDRIIGAAWGVDVRSQNLSIRSADFVALVAEAWAFMGTRPDLSGWEDGQRDLLDEAMQLLTEMGGVHDWPTAKAMWLDHVATLACCGLMTPPAFDPSDMSSAET